MSLFKRIFTWVKSEANWVVNKIEDPIKMTEQGIRDLKKDLESSINSLAEIKALSITAKRNAYENENIAKDYNKKAVLLMEKAKNGVLSQEKADELATQVLSKANEAIKQADTYKQEYQTHDKSVSNMQDQVKKLRSQISSWENELKTLKARSKVANSVKKLNKTLANTDTSGTISMLENMKAKVEETEALAKSYGEISAKDLSLDEKIDKALDDGGSSYDSLNKLKEKMGIK